MAAPTIDSITVTPTTPLGPGQTATITVVASHPDHPSSTTVEEATVTVVVTDKDGNASTPGTATVRWVTPGTPDPADPLTYTATADQGTVTGGGIDKPIFTYKAP